MNPILKSESFERAAYNLVSQLEVSTPRMQQAADTMQAAADSFRDSVDRLIRAMGMLAENMQRAHLGDAMAYTEKDF